MRACAGLILLGVLVLSTSARGAPGRALREGIVQEEFIYEEAPFPQCHASTIAQTPDGGLVAAWFGGPGEGNLAVGIWVARHVGGKWTAPVEAANGVQDGSDAAAPARFPCWNPVLFQPKEGPLLLFFKVGPHPSAWWGMLTTSADGGRTWAAPRRLPDGILGPIKNKPIQRPDGALLCPSSSESAGWRVFMERTADLGRTWDSVGPLNDGKTFGAIQPTLLVHPEGVLQILCRSQHGRITECWSRDGGRTWTEMAATALPNPNAGIDATTLRDGRHVLVYNHTARSRTPLNVAVSADGRTWKAALVLERDPGEFSYPAVIQTRDGLVHITYTWKRQRVRHVVTDPAQWRLRDMPEGTWPGE